MSEAFPAEIRGSGFTTLAAAAGGDHHGRTTTHGHGLCRLTKAQAAPRCPWAHTPLLCPLSSPFLQPHPFCALNWSQNRIKAYFKVLSLQNEMHAFFLL